MVLKNSVEHPGAVAEAQTERRDGNLDVVYRHALNGYAATLPTDEIDSLRDDPRVAFVTRDHEVSVLEEEVELETEENGGVEVLEATIPTGINRIFAPGNKALDIDGKDDLRADVDVAVIDTGIDYEHPDLNVVARTSCVTGTCIDDTGKDGHSHGTHVAGTIGAIDNGEGVVGVAPGARMWAVKVLSDAGSGSESWIIAGVDWVTAHAKEIEVANMSLGCFCSMPALDKAINGSIEAGVVYAVAAGNSNTNVSSFSPASNPNVISVSAIADYDGLAGEKSSYTCQNYGLDDRKASFSNYGAGIEIAAPGVCILSTVPGNQYGYKSGTSMASPHVAGAAAVLATQSNPGSKKDVETIRETLIKAGNTGWLDTSGDGVLEPLLDVSSEATFKLTSAPKVATEAATSVKTKEATLNGTVNPSGLSTSYRFEYGKTTSYGTSVPVPNENVGSGTETLTKNKTISGLLPETTYHYRIVAESSAGTTYGTDRSFTTLAIAPSYMSSFGSEGSGPGQFQWPTGLVRDAAGNLWVSDSSHSKIQKFDEKGEYLSQVGSPGSGNGQLNGPTQMAFTSSGDLWVADGNNHRLQKFNSKGEYVAKFGSFGSGNGQFNYPWGIAIAANGDIWVTDLYNDRLQEFTAAGVFVREVHGVGYGGSANGEFSEPTGIAIDSNGNIWVADKGNQRIQKLTSTGTYLAKFGSKGTGNGQFEEPYGVTIKPSGNLFVTDFWNHRVQQFSPDGEFLGKFGGEGSMAWPYTVALGPGGTMFVLNPGYREVQKWQQPTAPEATTQAATAIKANEATLNGTVNPSGASTTYRFEYGKTTAYGTSVPVPSESVGSGTEPIAKSKTISGLSPGITYHYRIVAENSEGTTYGKDETFVPSIGAALSGLAVTHAFTGSGESVASFAANWSVLGWATGGTPKGEDTVTGWRPVSAYPTVNGAYYGTTVSGSEAGSAAVATMAVNPANVSRYFSLWLGMSTPGTTRNGYELRFTNTSAGVYTVALYKWQEGTQSTLASKASISFANGNSFALVDQGGTVSGWTNTGSGFAELLSASDSTFAAGKAALEGAGNITRLTNFKAGSL